MNSWITVTTLLNNEITINTVDLYLRLERNKDSDIVWYYLVNKHTDLHWPISKDMYESIIKLKLC